jgi:C-lobe and N-lobe beta barrels of Tf-binding protein B
MRVYLGLAAVAALSACGGTGGSGVTPAPNPNGPPVMGVNIPGGIVGRTFTANTASTESDPANPSSSSRVFAIQEKVKFLSATQAEVSFGSNAPITVTYSAADDAFVDSGQTIYLRVLNTLDGVTRSRNLLYFFVSDYSGANTYFDAFVHGNRTPVASMPTTGQATYSGSVDMIDGTGLSSETIGSFNLTADFVNSQIGGTLTGVLPANTALSFDLVPGTISGNGFITGLTSVGNATTVNANSIINGRFFGHDASEVGGTILLDTTAGNASGAFGGAVP